MALKFGLSQWRAYHPRKNENAPIVLCFGDSWFWYPMPGVGNLSNRFLDFGKYKSIDIAAIGRNGMRISSPGDDILSDLTKFLQAEGNDIDMISVSGGGNDLSGSGNLDSIMKKGTVNDISSWFKKKESDELFASVKAGYERVIYLRNTFCPTVPIVTHCYDYPQALGKGVLWIPPWIKPAFDKVGMPEEIQPDAIRFIIDHLADIQLSLSGNLYYFIDTRNTLESVDWSNELHPTGDGFNKLAKHFFPVFQQYFPDWTVKPNWY